MEHDNKLQGLRGWLALLGLGVVLGPFRMIAVAIATYSDIYAEGTWALLTTEGSPVYQVAWAPLIIGEIIVNTCLFILSVYAAYLFFTKKSAFPRTYILLLTLPVFFIVFNAFLVEASGVFPGEPAFDEDTLKELARSLFVFVIWVPYLLRSKRVKATFINSLYRQKARKTLAIATAVSITVLIGLLITDTDYRELDDGLPTIAADSQDINSLLLAIANETNKDLPMMVDAETRLDTTQGLNGEFAYKYTLVNFALEEVDQDFVYETMKPVLTNSVCTTEEMRVFVDNQVPVKYLYYGKYGKQVASILITPDECQVPTESGGQFI